MREIIFKAKRLDNGEWIKGNVFFSDDGKCGICVGTPIVRITYDVDSKTVCQYTGITDKNGNMIFEHDIITFREIKIDSKLEEQNGVVLHHVGTSIYNTEFEVDFTPEKLIKVRQKSGECEIIRNIYD